MPADGLTVTVSLGPAFSTIDSGYRSLRPLHLTPMRVFPNDSPMPEWTGGDVMLQLCANNPDTIHHAIRDITRHTRAGMQIRWKMQGYSSPTQRWIPSKPPGIQGWKRQSDAEGSRAADLDRRRCRARLDPTVAATRWYASSACWWSSGIACRSMSRRTCSVAVASPAHRWMEISRPMCPTTEPDPDGKVTPAGRAYPPGESRTPETENQRLLRRSYNYDLGVDPNGNIQAGLIFIAYQQDISAPVRNRADAPHQRTAGRLRQPFGAGTSSLCRGLRTQKTGTGRSLMQ